MADVIDLLSLALKENIEATLAANDMPYSVWNAYAPSTEDGDCYVELGSMFGNPNNVKGYRRENYSVTITVYCRSTNIDPDKVAGVIRDGIYDESNKCLITIPGYQLDINGCNPQRLPAILFADAIFINRPLVIDFTALKTP